MAVTPPCPACTGELSLVAPAPLSPFAFYRVSLVVAGGEEVAAAPAAFPLADAGNAAENFFVAPAPRGSDGGDIGSSPCGSWASPCASIQPALDRLSSSSVSDPNVVASVWIAPGYYSGAPNGDLTFRGRKGIVRSLGGKGATLLDGEWQRRLFVFSSFESPQSVIMGKIFVFAFVFVSWEERGRERERASEREGNGKKKREGKRKEKTLPLLSLSLSLKNPEKKTRKKTKTFNNNNKKKASPSLGASPMRTPTTSAAEAAS